MAQMGRPGLSAAQKIELWRRWKEGQSLSEIGLALDRHAGSIHGVIRLRGGYAPHARRRSRLALRPAEREEISLGIIAAKLGRSVSTVSREIARHGGLPRYKAMEADSRAWDNARRPKRCRLAQNARLRLIVAQKLQKDWSPEQISGWLAVRYRDEDRMRVSHETIYRSLFVQARGVLKKELMEHLRGRRMMRRSQKSPTAGQPRGRIIDAVSIRERPAEVEDRAVPGHWEGDLISGSNNTHMATLVERQSRFMMLVKLDGKDALNVVKALAKQVKKPPNEVRRSLTWDRGGELALHKFPKGTDLSLFSQAELNKVAMRLNQRPRKTLGFCSPADKLRSCVASIG